MIETFTALICAHVLADFALQSNAMVAGKARRDMPVFATHLAILIALSALALLQFSAAFLAALILVGLSHFLIDIAKTFAPKNRALMAFITDQGAHLIATAAIAAAFPGLFANALWAGQSWLPGTLALISGGIVTIRAGGFAVGLLMARFDDKAPPEGLPEGGRLIGQLERGVIFLLVLAGQPGAIGFLIAAKSILRFEAVSKDGANPKSEYVIIGTLASFGWALGGAYATLALMTHLAPLGILPSAN
ncbi:DUF3307 domain-containing protein [Thioclava indica]|uniref:DUF3307 domain-containing protein n=1 Tax=Thioclava indica TaxID=1353528 RepID=A0A074JZM9_9RHOB|nr:DUF3307 domain-containing protein [Thioclava indica]KEO61405.1 hypothetical protein DT23_00120 [Thioclava indica]